MVFIGGRSPLDCSCHSLNTFSVFSRGLLADSAEIAAEVSSKVDIELEYEAAFDWVAFCPLRESSAGALTKYFGRPRGEDFPSNPGDGLGDAVKVRGIECRQHDTPLFVAQVQRELIATFDRTRDPEIVLDVLADRLARLADGDVNVDSLTVQQQVSKHVEEYMQETLTVRALQRAKRHGTPLSPGNVSNTSSSTLRHVGWNGSGLCTNT